MNRISVKGLTKRYLKSNKEVTVLSNCNLEINSNESVALIGINGGGKSTLLRIIAGVEEYSGGEIIIKGNISWPVGIYSGLIGSMTVAQNIYFTAELLGLNKKALVAIVLTSAAMKSHADDLVSTLSSGLKARLSFYLATSIDFDFYIFDEVSAVGDVNFRKSFNEKISELRQERSVIITSHDLDLLKNNCDYGFIIRDGVVSEKLRIDAAIKTYMEEQNNEYSKNIS